MSAEDPACAGVHTRLRDHSCHLTMNWQFKSPANKNNQHPPHLCQLLTFEPAANRLQGTCRHNDMTGEGNFISFDSYSTRFFFFFLSPSWDLDGVSLDILKVTVFVVYTFRSITLETVWAHSQRCLQLRLAQGWGYKQTWCKMMNVEIIPSTSEKKWIFSTIQSFAILHTDVILKTSLLNLFKNI